MSLAITQRVLSTHMGNTYPNHKGSYYYRNHTLYHISTLDPLGYRALQQQLHKPVCRQKPVELKSRLYGTLTLGSLMFEILDETATSLRPWILHETAHTIISTNVTFNLGLWMKLQLLNLEAFILDEIKRSDCQHRTLHETTTIKTKMDVCILHEARLQSIKGKT